MAVSTEPVKTDDNGFKFFNHLAGSTHEPENQSFNLQIFDLLPGTQYNEILRLSDKYGNWQYLLPSFTTLKRQIRVRPVQIFVHDDSDDLSFGEGEFSCTLYLGPRGNPSGAWKERGSWSTPYLTFDSNSALPPLTGEILVTPETVFPGSLAAQLSTKGRDEDDSGFDWVDDSAYGSPKQLDIPSNTVNEAVIAKADSIKAEGSSDLSFTLDYEYWIEYY